MEKEFTPIIKRFALAQLSSIGISDGKKDFNFKLEKPIVISDRFSITEVHLTKPLVIAECNEDVTCIPIYNLSDKIITEICEVMEDIVLDLLGTNYINLV